MITLKSNYAELKIDEKGGVCSLTNGKHDILAKKSPFCYLIKGGNTVYPVLAEIDGEAIKFTFSDGYVLPVKFTADDFFTFEPAIEKIPDEYDRFYLIDLNIDNCDDLSAILYTMNVNTITSDYPDAKQNHIFAYCTKIDSKGAKAALCAAPKTLHRDIMKKICDSCDPSAAIVSKAGGAYALDWKDNFGDYVIVYESEWEKVQQLVEKYSKYGINQFDFHKDANTFRHGDFHFYKFSTAKDFKTETVDKLTSLGIISGLHTYANYIDYGSDTLLSNPEFQKDLEIMAYYTLKSDIDENDEIIPVLESLEGASSDYSFFSHNSPYILIDNEIVKINIGNSEFNGCTRGECGTLKSSHKKGSKAGRIGGCFNMFAPVPGSPLFYQIARNTAKTYNEGGFSMIYLDAIDGMGNHTKDVEYYDAKFVHEIIKNCIKPPVIEYSSMYPSLWYARGRAGAWDVTRRAYKPFYDLHIEDSKKSIDRYYTTTLGWHHFWLLDDCPPNYSTKYQFSDDVEYLGTKAIAYNCSIVLIDISNDVYKEYDGLFRNMELYAIFNKLRKQNYFSQGIREKLKTGEYTLSLKDGEYVFSERIYQKFKSKSISSRNPFSSQIPFIRIEALYSANPADNADNENPVALIQFDKDMPLKEISEQERTLKLQNPVDLTKNLALCARVFGNNSSDVISVRLSGTSDSAMRGVAEYFIPLDFSGWRDIIVAELDNGGRTDLEFDIPRKESFYSYYHAMPDFPKINTVVVSLGGECAGVKLESITMRRHTEETVQNLRLNINGHELCFEGPVKSSDYIEYNDGQADIYDSKGRQKPVRITGALKNIDGGFDASIECDNPNARFAATFGFTGAQLKEPEQK